MSSTAAAFHDRLTRFYTRYDPSRLDYVATYVADHHADADNFMRRLVAKYGPEPEHPAVAELRDFYRHHGVAKSDGEIAASVARFDEDMDKMWGMLERKYGPRPGGGAPATRAAPSVDAPATAPTPSPNADVAAQLAAFYRHYGVAKSAAEVDAAVARYAVANGGPGFDKLWSTLEQKYGPRPSTSASMPLAPPPPSGGAGPGESTDAAAQLAVFYRHYGVAKSAAEVDAAVAKYAGSYDKMWSLLETKYGPRPPSSRLTGAAAAAAACAEPAEDIAAIRAELTAYMQKYNPDKVKEVEIVLRMFRGRFDQMWVKLEAQYGPREPGFSSRPTPPSVGGGGGGGGGGGELPAETRRRALELFQLYDQDKNATIDIHELPKLLRSLGFVPSNAECRRILEKYDLNRDGTLSYDEFLGLIAAESPSLNATVPDDDALRRAFAAFDANGDGTVSVTELATAMATMGEAMSQAEIATVLRRVDPRRTEMDFAEFKRVFVGDGPARSRGAAPPPSQVMYA